MGKVFLAILILVVLVIAGQFIFDRFYSFPKVHYGVTFSPKFATALGMDWQKTYLQILDDLAVKEIRLPSYWDVLEPAENQDDFSSVDFMIQEAAKRGVKVILVLGARQPRWPECHIPSWAKNLTIPERQNKTLAFIKKVVTHYQSLDSMQPDPIAVWQVENEPLLNGFGSGCDIADAKFLQTEVLLVRSLDHRQVMVTDSGELGFWVTPMRLSDIFGTTLYRVVYNVVLGYTNYPLLPYLYNLKSALVRQFFATDNHKSVIIELQAEPWSLNNDLATMSVAQQVKLFSVDNFKSNISFAKKVGFDEDYLWGVEWWYWMRDHNHPEYLDYAKTLFK